MRKTHMRKTQWMVLATVAVLAVAGGATSGLAGDATRAPAAASVVKHQTSCPIAGGAIDKKLFADYEGKRVYFCCGGCPEAFKKDPAKYIKKMEADGITLDTTPPAGETKK